MGVLGSMTRLVKQGAIAVATLVALVTVQTVAMAPEAHAAPAAEKTSGGEKALAIAKGVGLMALGGALGLGVVMLGMKGGTAGLIGAGFLWPIAAILGIGLAAWGGWTIFKAFKPGGLGGVLGSGAGTGGGVTTLPGTGLPNVPGVPGGNNGGRDLGGTRVAVDPNTTRVDGRPGLGTVGSSIGNNAGRNSSTLPVGLGSGSGRGRNGRGAAGEDAGTGR